MSCQDTSTTDASKMEEVGGSEEVTEGGEEGGKVKGLVKPGVCVCVKCVCVCVCSCECAVCVFA